MRSAGLRGLLLGLALAGATGPLAAQSWKTVTTSRRLGGEDALDVRVTFGAGRFSVQPLDGDLLYRMRLRYDEDGFRPVADLDGRQLLLGLESRHSSDLRVKDGNEMDLELSRSVPMALQLDFGAGEADVDLGGVSLTGLEVRTGASEARIDISAPNPSVMARADLRAGAADFTVLGLGNLNARRIEVSAGVGDVKVDFTGAWRETANVAVKMGLGALELRFPEGLGVKLESRTFFTSLDAQGLVKRGDAYYSVDWESAPMRITVDVAAAFGSVDVRWVR